MEKKKYHFSYKDKAYWVWLWQKEIDLLCLENGKELTDEEYEKVKHFLNDEKRWKKEEKSEKE